MSEYSASASAVGSATITSSSTQTDFVVTASASAYAESDISFSDAYNSAYNQAQNLANVTAQYDANLITQATDISTYERNYNTKQINSNPDMTFYYSATNYFKSQLDVPPSTKIYNAYCEIFSDYNLTNSVGTQLENKFIYGIDNPDLALYNTKKSQTFILANGSVTIHAITPNSKSADAYYTEEGLFSYAISEGSGDYLNASGIITINYNNSNAERTRSINVYLN